MQKIRRIGAMKPWGSPVSSIEIALWDVAGQATDLPVYELLGGKIHDRVCAYGNSENNSPCFLLVRPRNAPRWRPKRRRRKKASSS